jgi:biotin carboxylase
VSTTTPSELLLVDAPGGPTPDDLLASLATWGPVRILMVRWNDEPFNAARAAALSRLGPVTTVPRVDHVLEAGMVLARESRLSGVVAFSEVVGFQAGLLAAMLGLPGHPPAALLATRRKDVQRAVLKEAGVPSTRTRVVRCAEDLDSCLDLRFPLVMKPAGGVSSFCMARVETPVELRPAWSPLVERYLAHPITHGTDPIVVVEEEIPWTAWHTDPRLGHQVSVEILLSGGAAHCLGVTDKTPLVPVFREEGHLTPTSLSAEQEGEVVAVAERAVNALGLRDGFTHTELILTEGGPVVLEVNGRIGGCIHALWQASRGYDCIRAAATVATGRLPELPARPVRHAAYVRPQPASGRYEIESIDRSAVAAALARTEWGFVDKSVGTEIDTGEGAVSNLARYLATAPTQDELLDVVGSVNADLADAIRLRPVDQPST